MREESQAPERNCASIVVQFPVLPKDRICEKTIQPLGLFVFHHRTTDCHHYGNRRIDLLIRSTLRRI